MAKLLAGVLLFAVVSTTVADRPRAQDAAFETTLVGVVVPDEVQPGDTVMGTVTLEPEKYEGIPGLQVITAQIPAPTNTLSGNIIEIAAPSVDPQQSGTLTGTIVDIPKDKEEQKKRGTLGKIFLKAAEIGASQVPLLFRRQGGDQIAARNIPVQAAGAPPETFEVPSVIGSNDIPVISGPVGSNPQIAVGDVPAEVVAAGPRSAAFEVPSNVPSGTQAVTLQDQPAISMTSNTAKPAVSTPSTSAATTPSTAAKPSTPTSPSTPSTPATPSTAAAKPSPATSPSSPQENKATRSVKFDDVTVVGIGLKASGPTKVVSRGTETPFEASIVGKIPSTLLERPLPKQSRYLMRVPFRAMKGAPGPGDRGKVGILIENRSPGTIELDGEQNGAIVKWFDRGDIERGQTTVKSKIIARRVGAYHVRARVMPMLPPAQGKVAPPVPSTPSSNQLR